MDTSSSLASVPSRARSNRLAPRVVSSRFATYLAYASYVSIDRGARVSVVVPALGDHSDQSLDTPGRPRRDHVPRARSIARVCSRMRSSSRAWSGFVASARCPSIDRSVSRSVGRNDTTRNARTQKNASSSSARRRRRRRRRRATHRLERANDVSQRVPITVHARFPVRLRPSTRPRRPRARRRRRHPRLGILLVVVVLAILARDDRARRRERRERRRRHRVHARSSLRRRALARRTESNRIEPNRIDERTWGGHIFESQPYIES